jgi:Druantia protein DruA
VCNVTCSWVRVPHLASHLLGRMSRQLSSDWQRIYAHPIYFTETFVDPERNRGTCYRAANWTALGLTKGRGKAAPTRAPNRSLKLLFGYPLVRDFRERLCAVDPS